MQWTSAVTETKHGLSDVQLVLFDRVARDFGKRGLVARREFRGFNARTFSVLARRGLVCSEFGKTTRGARMMRVSLTAEGAFLFDAIQRELEAKGY
jgi:hypothetical protein